VNTLHRERGVETFALNEIGRVEIRMASPIFFDPYKVNHGTGSFILIDPLTNNTVAAGMIRGPVRNIDDLVESAEDGIVKQKKSPHTTWSGWNIPRERREERYGHKGAVLWLTGYSGSGKSTIARDLEKGLFAAGVQTMLLDGDNIRQGLCGDLGFSERDRSENIRRAGEVAKLFFESGHVVIGTFISPFEKDRLFVRSLLPEGRFFEVYVKCDLDVCKRRDPNGLYRKTIAGEIKDFTGVSSPYEVPQNPEIVLETDLQSVTESVVRIIDRLKLEKLIRP
jgi:bifunctional enzyme CysN/CysC